MYSKIMVPVDLAHVEKLTKSLNTAITMARQHNATICYVAVSATAPSAVAHSTKELQEKLKAFAEEQGQRHDISAVAKVIETSDPSVELDKRLLNAIDECQADLVVMASHVPGVADRLHLMSSNGGDIAKHAKVSVFVVRE